jgi:trk system potassium uptake protein TrkH
MELWTFWLRFREEKIRLRPKAALLDGILLVLLALTSVVALVSEYALYTGPRAMAAVRYLNTFIALAFVLRCLIGLFLARSLREVVAEHRGATVIFLILFLQFLVMRGIADPRGESYRLGCEVAFLLLRGFLIVTEIYKGASLVIRRFKLSPPTIVLLSFLLLIAAGTFLLLTPRATPRAKPITFVDALFTSTSATCVTGLIVRDTGGDFTRFGQGVILCLIQLGGLGIMTFGAFMITTLGRGLGIRGKVVMMQALNYEDLGQLTKIVRYILYSTFLVELVGLGLFYLSGNFPAAYSLGEKLYYSLFHSISAFCNAGFSLYSDSLMNRQATGATHLLVAGLIIWGGLGFAVTYSIVERFDLRRFFRKGRRGSGEFMARGFNIQTKVVVTMTLLLILAGMLVLLLYERDGKAFRGLGWGEKVLAAFFQSVTTRTAGFNTVDTGSLSKPSLVLMIILMFIGASPGSTGGGIKTSTVAILFMSVVSIFRGRQDVEVFRRTVPRKTIGNAFVLLVCSLSLIGLLLLILTYTEIQKNVLQVTFELFSAFGTVGLSTGVTPHLSVAGRIVIVVAMFVGRVGPLTLVLAMAQRRARKQLYRYPRGNVMIG